MIAVTKYKYKEDSDMTLIRYGKGLSVGNRYGVEVLSNGRTIAQRGHSTLREARAYVDSVTRFWKPRTVVRVSVSPVRRA